MTYQNSMYGEANPSVARKRMLHSFLVLIVLSIYGYVTEFLPSRAWANLGLVFSVLLTIIFSVNIYWALFSGRLKESAKKPVLSRAITFLSLPFFLFALRCFGLALYRLYPVWPHRSSVFLILRFPQCRSSIVITADPVITG